MRQYPNSRTASSSSLHTPSSPTVLRLNLGQEGSICLTVIQGRFFRRRPRRQGNGVCQPAPAETAGPCGVRVPSGDVPYTYHGLPRWTTTPWQLDIRRRALRYPYHDKSPASFRSIPKALAERIGIRVGDELSWEDAAGTLRARVATAAKPRMTLRERLRLFDAATARQVERERKRRLPRGKGRGWTREDLYTR